MKTIIDELHPDSYRSLYKLYNSDKIFVKSKGRDILLDKTVRISLEQGQLLRMLCHKFNAIKTLEIGFAYGFSTIWILDAIRVNANSSHTAIDPFEKNIWGGVGLQVVQELSFDKTFNWIEDYSLHAIPSLIKNNQVFDFVFIDGMHRFDNVLLDFYLCDIVLNIGGIIVFDDTFLPSVRKAIEFIRKNRAYEDIQTSVANVAVFIKTAHDGRNWDHFNNF